MAFDLDGTLAESKQRITPQMGKLLGQLTKKMPVAIMSGASFKQFEIQFLPELPEGVFLPHLFLFPTNAASCYQFMVDGWHPIYDHTLSENQKKQIVEAIHSALAEVGMSETPSPVWGERIEDRGTQVSFSGLGQQAPIDAKRAWDPSGEKKKKLRDVLTSKLPDFTVTMSGSTTIDITQKGINKAHGITRLAELTHIAIGDMLYVGDALYEGGNDAVVIATGVPTHQVLNPEETAQVITAVVACS